MEKVTQDIVNNIKQDNSPEVANLRILRHIITDWSNTIVGLTCFDTDIDELKKK